MQNTNKPRWQRAKLMQDVSSDWETLPTKIGSLIWVENREPREGLLRSIADGHSRWTRFLFTHETYEGKQAGVPISVIELLPEFTYVVVMESVDGESKPTAH